MPFVKSNKVILVNYKIMLAIVLYVLLYRSRQAKQAKTKQMTKSKFILTQWTGCYVKGLCVFGADGFIKRYVSKAMADRSLNQIESTIGIKCKSVPNGKSWAIVAI